MVVGMKVVMVVEVLVVVIGMEVVVVLVVVVGMEVVMVV